MILTGLEHSNHTAALPEFDITPADQLLGALFGCVLVLANQIDGTDDVTIPSNDIRAKMLHGDAGMKRDTLIRLDGFSRVDLYLTSKCWIPDNPNDFCQAPVLAACKAPIHARLESSEPLTRGRQRI